MNRLLPRPWTLLLVLLAAVSFLTLAPTVRADDPVVDPPFALTRSASHALLRPLSDPAGFDRATGFAERFRGITKRRRSGSKSFPSRAVYETQRHASLSLPHLHN